MKEGTHIVAFASRASSRACPAGPRIAGMRGAVIVRDPQFGVVISHPDVVRRDEEYNSCAWR